MIGYLGSNKTKVNKTKIDNQGRILIVDPGIDKERFVLINLYHANAEIVQTETTYELNQLLSDFCLNSDENVILPGDFNLFYDPSLEASGGKAALKKNLKTFANN